MTSAPRLSQPLAASLGFVLLLPGLVFAAVFLLGRESYFWNGYHVAFYIHILSGPLTLVLGALLVIERWRRISP